MIETSAIWASEGRSVHQLVVGGTDDNPLTAALGDGSHGSLQRCTPAGALAALLRRRPTILVAMGLRQSALARLYAATHSGTSLVVPRNGLDHHWAPWTHALDRRLSGPVALYLTNSKAVQSHLRSHGYPANKIGVLESGLPDHWFEGVPCGPRPATVIMVGNDRPEKNHEFGLATFAASGVPGVLRLYTDNGARARQAWTSLPVTPGQQLEVIEGAVVGPADYDACAVILQPSLSESMPRALLEALSRGCRAVVSNVGAMHDVVDTNSCLDGFDLTEWAQVLGRELDLGVRGDLSAGAAFGVSAREYANTFLRMAGAVVE